MKLSQYLGSLSVSADFQDDDIEISAVCNNASAVVPGSVFCAIRGFRFDGHDFLAQAVQNGAVVLIVQKDCSEEKIPASFQRVIRVPDTYFAWGTLCAVFYGEPAKHFRSHGVTGTNGKTSTAILLHHFLTNAAHRKTGLLTTIFSDVCDGKRPDSANTMPDAAALQKLFRQLADNGAEDTVMECSSHGLSQSRCGSTRYASAIFTNLTGDHLDYHKTMDAYFAAKKRLFTDFAAPGMPAVINVDDPYGKRLYDELQNTPVRPVSISMSDASADYFVKEIRLAEAETWFTLSVHAKDVPIHTHLTGMHNICNTVCAFAAAAEHGVPADALAASAETAPAAPGRLEMFRLPNGAHAFVDYAHTDDAIFRVSTALNSLKKPGGRLIIVFGCGGDRDRTKRPRMGKVAADQSDMMIVTSDNPRIEDPLAIIEEIKAGIPAGTSYSVEPDRAKAIESALFAAKEGDLVLIAGKGHETYQEINGIRHHFDDREQVRNVIRKLSGRN